MFMIFAVDLILNKQLTICLNICHKQQLICSFSFFLPVIYDVLECTTVFKWGIAGRKFVMFDMSKNYFDEKGSHLKTH